jgi:hypothetical protein
MYGITEGEVQDDASFFCFVVVGIGSFSQKGCVGSITVQNLRQWRYLEVGFKVMLLLVLG